MDAKAEGIIQGWIRRASVASGIFLHQRKKAILTDGLLLYLMPGSLWRASCPPPSGPLLRNVQIRSRRICPAQESVHRQTTDKTKGPVFRLSLSFYLMPGSSLLSHGETPHYHRRYGVSLLSSAWGQVGPPRYGRQANSVYQHVLFRPVDLICIRLKIFSHPPKQLRRCKVKPHGSLVPVSSTHRCAYTPGLSTSSSSTFLQDSQGVRENSSRGKFRA